MEYDHVFITGDVIEKLTSKGGISEWIRVSDNGFEWVKSDKKHMSWNKIKDGKHEWASFILVEGVPQLVNLGDRPIHNG